MKKTIITTLAVLSLGLTLHSQAQDALADLSWTSGKRFGVGVQVGTLGFGPQVTYDISPKLYLRGEISFANFSESLDIDDIDYDGDLDFFSGGLTVNYLPFESRPVISGFRLTAGLFGVDNKVEVTASSVGQTIELGDTAYTLQAGDALTGETGFSSLAPYVGFGWDWSFGGEDQFTVSLDAGALFVGSPDVSLQANNTLAANFPGGVDLNAEIERELDAIRDDIEGFEIYPVVRLGLLWRF